jgi:isocitrate dehydrogenase
MYAVKTKIAVAHGDGIGPEIMRATLRILDAADAALDYVWLRSANKCTAEA